MTNGFDIDQFMELIFNKYNTQVQQSQDESSPKQRCINILLFKVNHHKISLLRLINKNKI